MRLLVFSIILLSALSGTTQTNLADNNVELFKVEEIDTMNDWHIIYSTKGDSTYMIVSSNETIIIDKGEKIEIGKYYPFQLISLTIINGTKTIPLNYLDFTGVRLDEETLVNINPEKGIYDIYTSKNVVGLRFVK